MINKDCNYISYKDFLDCTNKAEVKAEYINGKVFFKSPSHPNNNKIQNKLYAKLINNLDYKYEIYTSGVAVKFCKEEEMYQFEPDLMVLSDNNFENYIYAGTPKLIIEILSESTKEIDTVIKLEVYEKFEELAELDEKIKAVQLGLVDRATSSEGYEDLARESDRLNEEKQKILVTLAEDKGRQEKKAELIDFLHEQTTEFEEFDDGLVRRLIEQITVHENGTFTVEFKSGTMVEV